MAARRKNILDQSGKKLNDSGIRPLRATYTIRQATVQLTANRPVRAEATTVPHAIAAHDHDYYELCVVQKGSAKHLTDEGLRMISQGSVIVVPPGQVHAFASVRALSAINVYYLTEWLMGDLHSLWDQDGVMPLFFAPSLFRGAGGQGVRQFQMNGDESAAVGHELQHLTDEWNQPAPSLIYMKSTLLKLLVQLGRAFLREAGRAAFSFREEVFAAIQSIERGIADASPFDLQALAAGTMLSPDHLSRIFKIQTGLSPEQYFQRRRSQRAALMLLDSRKSVTEIAYELGYSDAAHFSRLFARLRGVSPRAYRKMYAVNPRG